MANWVSYTFINTQMAFGAESFQPLNRFQRASLRHHTLCKGAIFQRPLNGKQSVSVFGMLMPAGIGMPKPEVYSMPMPAGFGIPKTDTDRILFSGQKIMVPLQRV